MEFTITGNEMLQIWEENQKMLHDRREQEEAAGITQKDDNLLYLTETISKIVDMAMEVGQCDRAPLDLTPCTRVVRIKRALPMEVLRISHPESILYGGVFMQVKGLIIPHSVLTSIGYYSNKKYIHENKLPDWVRYGYNLGTMKDCGPYGFCFSKDDPISNHITYSSAWEFLELN